MAVKVAGASGTGLVTAIPLHSQNPQTQSGFRLIQLAQAGCRESNAPQATRSGNLLTRDHARVAAPVSADLRDEGQDVESKWHAQGWEPRDAEHPAQILLVGRLR